MRKSTPVVLSFLASLVLLVCGCQPAPTSTALISSLVSLPPTSADAVNRVVSPADAAALIAQNQGSSLFVILDVRTASEFAAGHLAGAINIDFYQSDFKSKLSELARDKTYLLYCRTGVRSAKAVAIMDSLGFTRLYDLSGGITQWTQSGYPVVQ